MALNFWRIFIIFWTSSDKDAIPPSTSQIVGASQYIANAVLKIIWPLKHHQFKIMFFMIKCFLKCLFILSHIHIYHIPLAKWKKTSSSSTKMPRAGSTGHWPCRMVEVAASLGISILKDLDRGQDLLLPYSYLLTDLQTCNVERSLGNSLLGYREAPRWCRIWAISRWYCLKSGTFTHAYPLQLTFMDHLGKNRQTPHAAIGVVE